MDNFFGKRTDLIMERTHQKFSLADSVEIKKSKERGHTYHTLIYSRLVSDEELIEVLYSEMSFFLNKEDLPPKFHVFVVGIGNDSHTADSIGPKVLKSLHINAHLRDLSLSEGDIIVSSLEPGVLGETGIETARIIESVKDEIKPDVIFIVDSFVTETPDYLNRSIELTDEGLIPGSGIKSNTSSISFETMAIPVITIGVPTAVELSLQSSFGEQERTYLLSTNDIDEYTEHISKVIASALNRLFQR